MNMYRILYKEGRKLLDEHIVSADSPYEAASRIEAAHPLNANQSLEVYNEKGTRLFRQKCVRNMSRKPGEFGRW